MESPLVSIIVPVYNADKYICKCVDSILAQTYKRIEVILINDGSTDKSHSLIKKQYYTDDRLVYIALSNRGVSKTRNYGIGLAKGEYITFVDSDDWIHDSFIEEAVKNIEKYNLDFILGGTEKVFSKYHEKCMVYSEKDILIYQNSMNEFIAKVISNGIVKNSPLNSLFTSGPVCKLFKKNIIKTLKFNEELVIGEDTIFNLEVLEKSKKIGIVPQIWYYYRRNNDSVTQKYNSKIKLHTDKLLSILIEKYYNNTIFRPYLLVRAVQQLHGMLLIYPLNKASDMSFNKQVLFIKRCLKEDMWKRIFEKTDVKKLPSNRFDKLLFWFCSNDMSTAIIILIKCRILMKRLQRKDK